MCVSKCSKFLLTLLTNFDEVTGVAVPLGAYAVASDRVDTARMVDVLMQHSNFAYVSKRMHRDFKNITSNGLVLGLNIQQLTKWMREQFRPGCVGDPM